MSSEIGGVIEQARAAVARSQTADASSTAHGTERQQLERIAQQFESMLLTQVLRDMRRAGSWEEDGEDDGQSGLGLDSFMETIDSELASHLSQAQGFGLSAQLLEAFDRMTGKGSTDDVAAANGQSNRPDAPASLPDSVPVTGDSAGAGDSESAADSVADRQAPVAGQVTSQFGWRNDPLTGRPTFHKGVDLRAAYGEDVQAAAAGKVVFSGEQRGYGTTVVLEHADGTRSRYAHLSAATVTVGSNVATGQSVGKAGHSGRATGTHLHFEVTGSDGTPIPPEQWTG